MMNKEVGSDDVEIPEVPEDPTPEEPVTRNDDSILNCTKKLCGIVEEDTSFDQDIIVNINSALFTLTQLGIGPKQGFQIEDNKATFSNFLGENSPIKGAVGQYLYIKTKLGFDFPSSTAVAEQLKDKANELEFRLMVTNDEPYKSELWGNSEIK